MADMSKYQDIGNIGNWPWPGKIVAIIIAMAVIMGLGYYLVINDQVTELESKQNQQVQKLEEFKVKYKKAANLELYRAQKKEIQTIFDDLLDRLPKTTEIPGLLDEISYAASAAGVDLISHSYQPEIPKDFYLEKPIAISAVGSYHQISDFVSRVSGLPRIVTLHNFKVAPSAEKRRNNTDGEGSEAEVLSFTVLAKTYRYQPKAD